MAVAQSAKDLQYGPIVAIVNSNSEPNKKYEVRQKSDGTLSCQCMGWRFNIKFAEEQIEAAIRLFMNSALATAAVNTQDMHDAFAEDSGVRMITLDD